MTTEEAEIPLPGTAYGVKDVAHTEASWGDARAWRCSTRGRGPRFDGGITGC
ncbi:hypothetical protein ERO13_D10G226700v2 [Gossypium hirsutum]|uniref:Uncharacterized protein n=3 Tax=Gossypium TaxID=3633 RepID=A0A5J5PVS3_GOSBA|nr:hypothetical protein ES319_D10G258300v1 [Gossypium barbadense]KAG4127625.1 hypothetical protein ERO13_D10G226700v2 [Gossypium hirsutum]TYH51507.1 hypothetical protein ES332_D10G280200v1 [Gossypium tomentosum]TYI62688.1 hypothetical protein E1A91_D10G264500v1 [Gossypium mustelinum]